jgi:hypothetical protein
MGQPHHPAGVLTLTITAAQAAADIFLWRVSGWPTSRLVTFTVLSGLLVAIFARYAVTLAAHASRAGKDGFAYLRILFISFLCTAIETIIITVSPLGRQAGSNQFDWTSSAVGIWLTVALVTVAAFIFTAAYVSDDYTSSFFQAYVLEILARHYSRQRLPAGFASPGPGLSATEIERVLPEGYPRGESREPQPTGPAGNFVRVTAWSQALLAANSRTRPRNGTPTPVVTAAGLVRLNPDDLNLAVIKYFRPRDLLRALRTMPREIRVEDQNFPVIYRPWLPVGQGGDGHCWVTFGEDAERYGIVTAKSAITEQNSATKNHVTTRSLRTVVSGRIRKVNDIMESALIEVNEKPRPRLVPAPHKRDAEIGPVRLCAGPDQVDGDVIALSECSEGGFYARNPEDEPVAPAVVLLNVFGGKGDSGALVLKIGDEQEERGGAPYLMYLGITQLGRAQEGYAILLEQISHHWKINTQFNLQAAYNPINAILDDRERRNLPTERGQTRGPADLDSKR